MSKPDNDEPFLSRWSRRKRAVESGATVDDVPAPDAAVATTQPGAAFEAEATREEELDLSTLPKVDELDATSDITAFLDKRVPALLRNAALSRMWTLDPTIRDFIEVAENQWNWNVPGGAPFYEEMLPGSTTGTLIADATSAISRTLEGSAATEQVVSASASNTENIIQQNVDVGSVENAALQQDIYADKSAVASEVVDKNVSASNPDGPAATQQITESIELPRRRHGGALPG